MPTLDTILTCFRALLLVQGPEDRFASGGLPKLTGSRAIIDMIRGL
jgi:hypothetical protein